MWLLRSTSCTPSACSACAAAAGPSEPSARRTPGGPRSSGPPRGAPRSPCYRTPLPSPRFQPHGAGPGSTQRDVVAGGALPAAVLVPPRELQAGPPGEIGRGERDPEQAEAEALRVPLG